ncbi:hypothetical protein [Streptomyces sp. NPDC002588]|uniref:hypothetical protein n=1 Tax=Streptomyces sp. NPDC002588 TaxID=3154419 RepID=UPI00331E0969
MPIWSIERRQIIIGAILIGVCFAILAGQLWLFNAKPPGEIPKNLIPRPPHGGLQVSVVEQALFLFIALCLAHLIVRPRIVLGFYRRLISPDSSQNPVVTYAYILHVAAVLVGTPWMLLTITRAPHPWAAGWIIFFSVNIAVVIVARPIERSLYIIVFGICRPPWQRPHDIVIWYLFICTVSLDESISTWVDDVRSNRQILAYAARAVERDRLPLRVADRFEFALRREIRSDQLRIAATIRAHGVALASVRNQAAYQHICDSMRAGLLAAVDHNWETLLATAPEVTVGTRLFRYLRRLAPSLGLILFAVGIPFLPGVDPPLGNSLRLLLFSTALLALMPIGDAASTTIKDALGKALAPTSKER